MVDVDDIRLVSASELKPGAVFFIRNADGSYGSARVPDGDELKRLQNSAEWDEKEKKHVTNWDRWKKGLKKFSRDRVIFVRKSKPFKPFD